MTVLRVPNSLDLPAPPSPSADLALRPSPVGKLAAQVRFTDPSPVAPLSLTTFNATRSWLQGDARDSQGARWEGDAEELEREVLRLVEALASEQVR